MPSAIDSSELARQTFGDAALAREIVAMFADQTPALLAALLATRGQARADVAHRLKGSALAVGATALARSAAALEIAPDDPAALGTVERDCDTVLAEIRAYPR
jgi:HPt (histidine-containing phosphotransfer) domain-containing protein